MGRKGFYRAGSAEVLSIMSILPFNLFFLPELAAMFFNLVPLQCPTKRKGLR